MNKNKLNLKCKWEECLLKFRNLGYNQKNCSQRIISISILAAGRTINLLVQLAFQDSPIKTTKSFGQAKHQKSLPTGHKLGQKSEITNAQTECILKLYQVIFNSLDCYWPMLFMKIPTNECGDFSSLFLMLPNGKKHIHHSFPLCFPR